MDCVQLCKNRTFFEFSNNLDVIFKKYLKLCLIWNWNFQL
ncbi:hypothetical protein FORMA_19010 [Formosa sp. Hel3_A1_48]|nr:hypothetical protein FORMA_19010 [Formosa sp. Hel3_A1_48]